MILVWRELEGEEGIHVVSRGRLSPHQSTSRLIMQRDPAPILSLSLSLSPHGPSLSVSLVCLYRLNSWRASAKHIVKRLKTSGGIFVNLAITPRFWSESSLKENLIISLTKPSGFSLWFVTGWFVEMLEWRQPATLLKKPGHSPSMRSDLLIHLVAFMTFFNHEFNPMNPQTNCDLKR